MTPDPVAGDIRTEGDFNVSQVWLDALARGTCDEDAFLRAIHMLTRRSPEAAWDSLALLDQYYRRGKIRLDVFKRVKSRLGAQLLGPALDVELSVPLKRQDATPPPAARAAPAPAATRVATPIFSPMTPVPPAPVGPASAAPAPVAPASVAVASTPATPAPAAPAAATSTPVGPTPVVPVPVAPAAVTPAPAVPAPVASTPVAPAPSAPAAAAPTLVGPTPIVSADVTPAPVASTPAAPAPAAPGPTEPAPPAFWAAPPRGPVHSPSGRTVPIGVDGTSIPVLSAVDLSAGETRESARREVAVGDVLRDRYVIKNVLGLGGTGTVFEAIDRYRLDLPDSGQRVAVKILHADTAGQSAVTTDLRREFQLLQSLSHPNIVRAHEYDRDGDIAFFTMEHLSGLSLESVLAAHREAVLERSHALVIIRDVAAALEHAHARGVVHGDLNPGNIFLTNDGEIRVLDFGAAHTPEAASMSEVAWDATAYATLRYASCQLLDGGRADARDDTYSLACVLYVLLAGKHPFGELNAAQARAQRLKPSRPAGLTGKQWHALRAGLSFDRDRRPADLAGWLEPFDLPKPETRLPVLLALLKASPRRSRRGGAAASIVLALAVLAAAGWWASNHRDSVSQIAGETAGGLKDALADADAALSRLWQQASSATSSSPTAEPPAAPGPAPGAARAPAAATAPEPSPGVPRTAQPRTTNTSSPSASVPAPHRIRARPAPAAAAQPLHARIELTADTVEVPFADPAAHVIVKRTGNLRADAGFTWWTESGTAKPGQDFISVKPREEHFENGKALMNLFVPVVSDPTRRQPKSFFIVINDPSGGASLGKRKLTMATILPSE